MPGGFGWNGGVTVRALGALAARKLRSSTKRALECTIRLGFYRALIAGLEFSLTTHFLLRISFSSPNTVISCILLVLYFTLQDQA